MANDGADAPTRQLTAERRVVQHEGRLSGQIHTFPPITHQTDAILLAYLGPIQTLRCGLGKLSSREEGVATGLNRRVQS